MEARAGIEPAIELLQSPALPLGYPAQGEGDSIGEKKKSQIHNCSFIHFFYLTTKLLDGSALCIVSIAKEQKLLEKMTF